MTLPLILWDIDDVLNRLTMIWLETSAKKFTVRIPYDELTENPPHELLNISKEDYLESLDDCRSRFLYAEPPKTEIMLFFRTFGHHFRHLALSSVPAAFMGRSSEWVFRYFGSWIQSVCFIPSPRNNDPVFTTLFRSKGEAAAAFGGILVDDSPANIASANESGSEAILFPAPWNPARRVPVSHILNSLLKKTGKE